jgi:hypothetical protein
MEFLIIFIVVLFIFMTEGWLFYKAITRLIHEHEREENTAILHMSRTREENTFPNKILPHETPIGSPRRRLFPEKTDSSAVLQNKNEPKIHDASGTGGGPWRRFRTWWNRTTR